jgi:hypothetical protein
MTTTIKRAKAQGRRSTNAGDRRVHVLVRPQSSAARSSVRTRVTTEHLGDHGLDRALGRAQSRVRAPRMRRALMEPPWAISPGRRHSVDRHRDSVPPETFVGPADPPITVAHLFIPACPLIEILFPCASGDEARAAIGSRSITLPLVTVITEPRSVKLLDRYAVCYPGPKIRWRRS